MKTYFMIYKFIFKATPKVSIGFLIMMASTTFYKVFLLDPGDNLFFTENITVDKIVFRILFTLLAIGSYGYIFGFMREMVNMDIFQLVPNIRRKILIFSFSNLLMIYIWSILILGFSNSMQLLYFTMLSLWFLSICLSLFFFDNISIYKSSKYWVFKLLFLIFSISGPLVILKDPMKRPALYVIIISIFLIVVFYQIINFLHNYINLNFKADITKSGLGKKANSLQNIIDNMYEGNITSIVINLKNVKLNKRYFSLFNITLFGPIMTKTWFSAGALISLTYINLINQWSLRTFFITILVYFALVTIVRISKYFKQKEKIEFLFIISELTRPQFELIILKVAIIRYMTRFLKAIPSMVLVIWSNNILFKPVIFYPLIALVIIVPIFTLISIYIFWTLIIKNKDYDTIKKAKVMQA